MMADKREINIFSVGDYNNAETFSGVPYYFIKTLESKGYNVHKFNIINDFISRIYDSIFSRFLNIFFKDSTYSFYRSKICYLLSKREIRKICKEYPDSLYNIFLTFSFSSCNISKIPVILFSDDTYEKLIYETKKRKPYFFEKYAIKEERKNLENADFAISLFPELKDYIVKHYNRDKNTFFIGNALNFETIPDLDPNLIIEKKLSNRNLLFIGRSNYMQGADLLVKAFIKFNNNMEDKYHLNIIGLKDSDLDVNNRYISFYGYLNKNNPEQFKKYIELIENSRFFINPTFGGGTYLTTLEVMYFYTPVIIYPHLELVKIFGNNLRKSGIILEKETVESLAGKIRDALSEIDNWKEMSQSAHEMVKDYTWDSFIDILEKKLET